MTWGRFLISLNKDRKFLVFMKKISVSRQVIDRKKIRLTSNRAKKRDIVTKETKKRKKQTNRRLQNPPLDSTGEILRFQPKISYDNFLLAAFGQGRPVGVYLRPIYSWVKINKPRLAAATIITALFFLFCKFLL